MDDQTGASHPGHATPPEETRTDESLVTSLLRDQHPDLADEPLRFVTHGWDNVTWRLGDDLAVRLPRTEMAAELVVKEQEWLPSIGARIPLDVPWPVRVGLPGRGYPWHWSVVRWIEGETLDLSPASPTEARRWGETLACLHTVAPARAPVNPYRAQALPVDRFEQRIGRADPDVAAAGGRLVELVRAAALLPRPQPRWVHGDLHPRNVVGDAGRIIGIIDWGDLTAGDPATDLASMWLLFEPARHEDVIAGYGGADRDTVIRSVAWAAHFGVLLATITDDPAHVAVGKQTLQRLFDAGL